MSRGCQDAGEGRGKGAGARGGKEEGKEGEGRRGKGKKKLLKLILSSPRSGLKIGPIKTPPSVCAVGLAKGGF